MTGQREEIRTDKIPLQYIGLPVKTCFVADKRRNQLRAEVLRDIGILLFVFAPLDTMVRSGHGNWFDWLLAIGIAILGLSAIEIGVRMEASQ